MEWRKDLKGQTIKTRVNNIPVIINTELEEPGYWSQYAEMKEFMEVKEVTKEFIQEKVVIEKAKPVRKAPTKKK
jgi:hypothetical protein